MTGLKYNKFLSSLSSRHGLRVGVAAMASFFALLVNSA